MATSNRDRVGRGFELLAEGLEPFVSERMAAARTGGTEWVRLLEARDNRRGGAKKTLPTADVQLQLRMPTEEGPVFKDYLSRAQQSLASELRETRNRWAHMDAFNAEDTYRALDSTERLLSAVGSVEHAEQVRRIRIDHQRATYDAEVRKATRAAAATARATRAGTPRSRAQAAANAMPPSPARPRATRGPAL